jgi:hypothetical protein
METGRRHTAAPKEKPN